MKKLRQLDCVGAAAAKVRRCGFFVVALLGVQVMLVADAVANAGVYLERDAFLEQAFDGSPPAAATIWLSKEQRAEAAAILSHPYRSLRVRYWRADGRMAFILDEIGKEKPITIGVVVEDHVIRSVKILEFRESRGWEVKSPAFTAQFTGGKLVDGNDLDRRIDGITGATLSVRAVTKVSRLALAFYGDLADGDGSR